MTTFPSLDTSHPDVGRRLGPYRILGLLGRGGLGLVYLAEHSKLGRRVAIKRLRDHIAARPEAVEAFVEEARAVNAFRHAHIADITSFEASEGQPYTVMELLEGQTLAALLADSGPLAPERALHIAHQIADALATAHDAGIVHLDVKPSNIFVCDGEAHADFVKLLDFGMAQLIEESDDPKGSDPDAAKRVAGTPVYMSPEQVLNQSPGPHSDLYSLGVVLYEMLAGRPPFEAQTTVEFFYKHMEVAPPKLSSLRELPWRLPKSLDRTVQRCLAKVPDDRYASASALSHALSDLAHQEYGFEITAGGAPQRTGVTGRARRLVLYVAFGAALLGIGAGLGIAWQPAARPLGPFPSPAPRPQVRRPPKTLHVLLESSPAGAEVYKLGGRERLLGLTPLTLTPPASSRRWLIALRLEGHLERQLDLDLGRGDQHLQVLLKRTAPPTRRPSPRANGGLSAPRRPFSRLPPRLIPPVRPTPTPTGLDAGLDANGTVNPFERPEPRRR